MKISGESDDLAEEVCTVLNIHKRMKRDQQHSISNILGYGMLVLDDVDEIGGDSQLMAYYVMPQNQTTFLDYLQEHREWYRLDAILHVGCQLLQIIQSIHATGYTYNNVKHENVMINEGQVILIGFAHTTKIIDHKCSTSRKSQTKVLASTIKSPYNDIASIYNMMI